MKTKHVISLFVISAFMVACGGNAKKANDAELFKGARNDAEKVAIAMKNYTPDSVARFICNTCLGLNKGVSIDTLQSAVLYAYENYKEQDLIKFSEEFDNFTSTLPLAEKMKILSLAALTDPDGLGYKLGLEYAVQIRDEKLTLEHIDRNINELKASLGEDSETFLRVLNGLSVALSMPEFSGLPKDIIEKYGTAPKIKVKKAVEITSSESDVIEEESLSVYDTTTLNQ